MSKKNRNRNRNKKNRSFRRPEFRHVGNGVPSGSVNVNRKPASGSVVDDLRPVGDIVRFSCVQLALQNMPLASYPRTMIPVGVEFRISHGRDPVEDQSSEKEHRFLHVAADHSGCGWWRLHEVEDRMNYGKKATVINTSLRFPKEYFAGVKFDAIRLQRQLGLLNFNYWQMIRQLINELNLKTRMIYEIDDVVVMNNIPSFNESKSGFESDDVQKSMRDILDLCDEFFVVSPYMKEIYHKFHRKIPISVIPNFASRAWFDGFYDFDRRMNRFDVHRKRPRVLLSGGATHVNPYDRSLYGDSDYSHVVDAIISARKDFEFVIMGVQPNVFRSFVENGEMLFCGWRTPYDFPRTMNELDVQCSIAPLANNDFNRAKSSIKWQEACYMGFGFVGQNLDPYFDARNLFTTGDELIDILKTITKDDDAYAEEIKFNRNEAEKYWIDDKIDDFITLYTTPYGDDRRKSIDWFVKNNQDQFSK